MDGLILLAEAWEAGLVVEAEGDKLVIRGPKQAEPVARRLIAQKPEVIVALAETAEWRARHREALAHWRAALHPEPEAARLAWGEMEMRWHRLHGARVPTFRCVGCGEPMSDRALLDLADGCRVHFDSLDCLLRHGRRWRGAAACALATLGLQPPAGGSAHETT
jgi:hypothetical protein